MEDKHSFLKKFLIAIALILFILFCASQKQAHALTIKDEYVWNPDIQNKSQTYDFWSGSTNAWIHFPFTSNWTNNTDYDLIGFHFNNNSMVAYKTSSSTVYETYNSFTISPILWDTNGTGIQCYLSGEYLDFALCPITKGTTYNRFSIIVNVVDNNIDFTLHYAVDIERSRRFFNYDSTDIITYIGGNGGLSGIVIEQQQTNDLLQDSIDKQEELIDSITGTDVTGATTNGINDINSSASSISTELDTAVGTGDFVSIFTTFFSQIDNSTCTPITLPIPYTNENLVLPCLGTEFQNRIPLLWTLYVTIITGVIVFKFWRFYIDMFKHLLDPYSTGLHGVSDIAGGGK